MYFTGGVSFVCWYYPIIGRRGTDDSLERLIDFLVFLHLPVKCRLFHTDPTHSVRRGNLACFPFPVRLHIFHRSLAWVGRIQRPPLGQPRFLPPAAAGSSSALARPHR